MAFPPDDATISACLDLLRKRPLVRVGSVWRAQGPGTNRYQRARHFHHQTVSILIAAGLARRVAPDRVVALIFANDNRAIGAAE